MNQLNKNSFFYEWFKERKKVFINFERAHSFEQLWFLLTTSGGMRF